LKKLLIFTVCFLIATAAAFGIRLQTAYDQAGPGEGYAKLLVLDPKETYTGGCGVLIGKKSCIRGNGALVDLDGGNIQAGGSGTQLDISGCCLINAGYYGAINVTDFANATADGNTITKSNGIAGIRVWEYSTATLKNNIIWGNATYGVAKHQNTGTTNILYNDVDNNKGGNYVYWCPG
jgi:hypothetical protein